MTASRVLTSAAAGIALVVGLVAPASAARSFGPGAGPVFHPGPLGREVTLAGSVVPKLESARRLGALNAGKQLSLAISFRARNRAGLDHLIHQQYAQGSLQFHHWITPGEFAARFAPTPAQRERVVSWLSQKGFTVSPVTRNGLLIRASGSVARVERAFGTHMSTYQRGQASFYANSVPVHLPRTLASTVQGVFGLDNAYQDRPLGLRHLASHTRDTAHEQELDPVSPADLATAYDLQPFYDAGLHGEGQTIALWQETDYSDQDIAGFDAGYGLPAPNISRISVDGGVGINDNQGEAELDIEVAHAIAPAARILVYEGPANTSAGKIEIWNQIVSDDQAQVASSSYGRPENERSKAELEGFDLMFAEAAAQGQSVFSASGDQGAYDASASKGNPLQNKLCVDSPASDPFVTAVGGTTLHLQDDNSLSEAAWSEPKYASGGGGGLSQYYKLPWYQTGPGVNNSYSNGNRQVPDVSALAGYPWYNIYTVDDKGKNPGFQGIAGTSAATPFWASFTSLVNEVINGSVGFLNPTLYELGQKASTFTQPPYNDVSTGDNLYYPATTGWDFATGWGSMDGLQFVNDLRSLGGPYLWHPLMWHAKLYVTGPKNGQGKYPVLKTVHRGQKILLLDQTTYDSVPLGVTPATREYIFANGSRTLVDKVQNTTIDHSAWMHSFTHSVKLKIPKSAPLGRYTFTWKFTVQGSTGAGTTSVTLK